MFCSPPDWLSNNVMWLNGDVVFWLFVCVFFSLCAMLTFLLHTGCLSPQKEVTVVTSVPLRAPSLLGRSSLPLSTSSPGFWQSCGWHGLRHLGGGGRYKALHLLYINPELIKRMTSRALNLLGMGLRTLGMSISTRVW